MKATVFFVSCTSPLSPSSILHRSYISAVSVCLFSSPVIQLKEIPFETIVRAEPPEKPRKETDEEESTKEGTKTKTEIPGSIKGLFGSLGIEKTGDEKVEEEEKKEKEEKPKDQVEAALEIMGYRARGMLLKFDIYIIF